ncbi:MAG TPA: HAD family hydrolase [Vicinamibacterales bacterium]|nr:HAD family hydrolase [Vicinamibacterales bacterium]
MVGTRAVFFDVDFTLIHPGPRFQGVGYQEMCARHGVAVDAARFEAAVAAASGLLDSSEQLYDAAIFVNYTNRIIELMGGAGPGVDAASQELYDEWAQHHHFSLYEDVSAALRRLHADGHRLGLISNSHRCLVSFQSHFELDGLIAVAVSSSAHGYLKPHPSIFRAALELMQVRPDAAVMVGDSLAHDVDGARQVGMSGVLLDRGGRVAAPPAGVPVIRSLDELPDLLSRG